MEHQPSTFVCPNCNGTQGNSDDVRKYHMGGSCIAMRRLLSVMLAREREGLTDHVGLSVDGITLKEGLS